MIEEKAFDDWDMEMSKWRGYVVRALEDSNVELKEIKESIKLCDEKIGKTNEKIDEVNGKIVSLKIRVAEIGAGAGLLTSLVFLLLSKFI